MTRDRPAAPSIEKLKIPWLLGTAGGQVASPLCGGAPWVSGYSHHPGPPLGLSHSPVPLLTLASTLPSPSFSFTQGYHWEPQGMCSRSPDPGAHMDKRTVNTGGQTSSCKHHGLESSHLVHLPQEHRPVPTVWCMQLSPVI